MDCKECDTCWYYDYDEEYDDYDPVPKRRNLGWIVWLLVVLIIGALTAGGFWGYKNYYLQNLIHNSYLQNHTT